MRTVIGLVMAGLALVLAGIGVFPALSQPAGPAPAGPQTITLTASGASYLSPTRLTEVSRASVQVTDTIREGTQAGAPLIDVWRVVTSAVDTVRRQPLAPMSATFAFDRTTAELVNCCNENLNGNSAIQQSGIAGWVFPRGTRKQTYDVFDTTVGKPEPFAYSGTSTVDGIPAYEFTESVSAKPAGFTPLLPTDPERYSMHRTYWVDPRTGVLLKISEDEDLYLVNAATGATVTHVFDADLSTTPASVASLVSRDTRDAGSAPDRFRLPFLGVASGLAVIAGVLLLWSTAAGPLPRRPEGEQ